MDPFVTPIDMDEIILTGTGANVKRQSIDTGYNYILLENNSEHDIDVSFTDPRTHPELSTITVNPMECLPLPKLNNRKFVIFIEGVADDTVHLYYCDSKFPEMFVEMLGKRIIKENMICWRNNVEVNNVLNHYIVTAFKLDITCFTHLLRYGKTFTLYSELHDLKVFVKLRNDATLKSDDTALTYTFGLKAGVGLEFPPGNVEVQISNLIISHIDEGVNVFNCDLILL